MKKLRFAVIGTGFWARYQIPAWLELEGVELVALYNRTRSKAEDLAQQYKIPGVYNDFDELLDKENLDFVDIITDVDTHWHFTQKAAERGLAVVCQKPMATNLEQARNMLDYCQQQGVSLFIHENFRWQAPIRAVKQAIDSGQIGKVFKARVSFCSAFPVFDNQPFLAELEHFILTDIGSHVLDKLEKEAFPQTHVLVEGELGSIQLTHDFQLRIHTATGTQVSAIRPQLYPWLDPDYAVVHSSIVDCNRDILNGLRGGNCETTGADNLNTVKLVWGAYQSAATQQVVFP